MKDTIVFDLDGTLSDGRHRLHLLPRKEDVGKTDAWIPFNMAAGTDAPIRDNIQLLRELSEAGYRTIILTGRGDCALDVTLLWLEEHDIPYDYLIMRPQEDCRKDVDFKEEKLREIGLDRILCIFDDLEHVCRHARSLGLTAHQVTHYDNPDLHVRKQETE